MTTNDVEDLIKQISDPDDEVRKNAVDTLALLEGSAKEALPALRNQLLIEESWEIQGSIVRGIATIEADKSILTKVFLGYLGHTSWKIRQAVIDALAEIGPTAKEALDPLWARLLIDDDDDVLESAARAISTIDSDRPALVARCIDYLKEGNPRRSFSAVRILAAMNLNGADQAKASDALWAVIVTKDDVSLLELAFDTFTRLSTNKAGVLLKLIDDPSIGPSMKDHLMFRPDVRLSLNQVWRSKQPEVLRLLLRELTREDANKDLEIQFLTEHAADIPPNLKDEVLEVLRECFRTEGLGFSAITAIGGPAAGNEVLNDPKTPAATVGRCLLMEREDDLNERWKTNKESVLPAILAALETRQWDIRSKAAKWLTEKANEIPPDSHNRVVEAVTRVSGDRGPSEVLAAINAALIQLRQRERDVKTSPLLDVIRDEDAKDDTKIEAVTKLLEAGTRDAMRALTNEWVQWIAYDNKALVEATGDLIRSSPVAVQPLVDLLNQTWQPDVHSRFLILFELLPFDNRDLLGGIYEGTVRMDPVLIIRVEEWINSVGQSSEKIIELKKEATANKSTPDKLAKAIMDVLLIDELKNRVLKVHYRIARQLADMSDPKFFDEESSKETYRKIREELKRHAVPVLGRRLPREENVEIREGMAQALGYIGGREAVDALSRAVAGEERIRTARQELLAKYYLEPSKARSEEAANILKAAADEAKRTLRLQHHLNVAIFFVGLLLLAGGLSVSMFTETFSTRVVSALASFGGFAGLLYQMIYKPLERIQHAMANLVQIETAFTSFIWELNLNGTYIQSQYVAEGVLTDNEIAQTVRRIEDAMNLAMNLVAVYTQDRGQRIVTRINNLVPAAGGTGAEVTISGQHLLGDSADKKDTAGIIAIDHAPINSTDVSWNDREVKFKLPQTLPSVNEHDQTVWISLFVDGMETNALPFHVVRQ